mmetsp:Transcript_135/g.344  ORF Transcript_135/g.344 Transcript_135/m.344 type:complete len:861 (-) Transcript_135:109-2691(-)
MAGMEAEFPGLLAWVSSFGTPVTSIDEVCSGEVLCSVASLIFKGRKFVYCASAADRFRSIVLACEGTLDGPLPIVIDVARAARGDGAEVNKIMKLLLFSAVTSPENATFVKAITGMDTAVQNDLMTAISEMRQACASVGVAPLSPAGTPTAARGSPIALALSPTVVYKQRTPGTADGKLHAENRQLRDQLQRARNDAYEAGTLYDEAHDELAAKNRVIDELRFRVRDAEATVDRLKPLEDEVDDLRRFEQKYTTLSARYHEASTQLEGAKATEAELAKLRKAHNKLVVDAKEATASCEALDTRVKDYRVRLKTAEQQLLEEQSGAARKEAEMTRLSSQRDRLQEQLSLLKAEKATLRTELDEITTQRPQFTQKAEPSQDVLKRVTELERENAELTASLATKEEAHRREIAALCDELDDAKGLHNELAKKLTLETSERDARISELEFELRQQADDVSGERQRARRAQQLSSKANAFCNQQLAELRRVQQENDDLKRAATKQQARQERVNTAGPSTTARRYGSVAPWESETSAQDVSNPTSFENMTDAARRAEIARRNKKQPAHLRSDYALEQQYDDAVPTTSAAAIDSAPIVDPLASVVRPVDVNTAFTASLRRSDTNTAESASDVVGAKQGLAMTFAMSPPKKVAAAVARQKQPAAKKKMPARFAARAEEHAKRREAAAAKAAAEKAAEEERKKKTNKSRTARKPLTAKNQKAGKTSGKKTAAPSTKKVASTTKKTVGTAKSAPAIAVTETDAPISVKQLGERAPATPPIKKGPEVAVDGLASTYVAGQGKTFKMETGLPLIRETFTPMSPELNSTHKKQFDSAGSACRRRPLGLSSLQNTQGPLVDYLSPARTPSSIRF